jgi:hypothetical protein
VEDPDDWITFPLESGQLTFIAGEERKKCLVIYKVGADSKAIPWTLVAPSANLQHRSGGMGLYTLCATSKSRARSRAAPTWVVQLASLASMGPRSLRGHSKTLMIRLSRQRA